MRADPALGKTGKTYAEEMMEEPPAIRWVLRDYGTAVHCWNSRCMSLICYSVL